MRGVHGQFRARGQIALDVVGTDVDADPLGAQHAMDGAFAGAVGAGEDAQPGLGTAHRAASFFRFSTVPGVAGCAAGSGLIPINPRAAPWRAGS